MIQDIPTVVIRSADVPVQNLSDYRNCAYSRASGFGRSMGKREAIAAKAAGRA